MNVTEINPDEPVRPSRARVAEPVRTSRAAKPRAAAVSEEFIDPATGEPYRRRSRRDVTAGMFEVPKEFQKPGWDYQWEATKVLGEPVDGSVHAALKENGWQPVRPDEMPGMMLESWTGKTIERGNQMLYKRPKYLSDEARAELKADADKQVEDKLAQAQMAPKGTAPRHFKNLRQEYEPLPDDAAGAEVEEV